MEELTDTVLQVIRKRPKDSHKGTFGRVVLIGGNQQYGGAILMAAQACVNSGAGLTTVISDAINRISLHSRVPEAMFVDWSDHQRMEKSILSADIILIGPGLGESDESLTLLQKTFALQSNKQWLVIDGSAINLFATYKPVLNFPRQTVFTPHQMEWQRLSGIAIEDQEPIKNRHIQEKLKSIVVLKSHHTEIYGQTIRRNPLGNPAMATGGMGDTLAGIISGFLAQFIRNEQTVQAAVYVHSAIGDQLAKVRYVVLPTEISQQLPFWMKRYSRCSD